jgi:hypothetical protein
MSFKVLFLSSCLKNAFEVVQSWTKTSSYMLQNFIELQNYSVFPPNLPHPDDAKIEEVVTRYFMFLVTVHVPLLFLSFSGYMAWHMWEILYPEILQRKELVICAPLVKGLQVASTGTAL